LNRKQEIKLIILGFLKIFGIDVNVKVWQCATVISINHGKIIELDLSKD
jgi:hypothetical protein